MKKTFIYIAISTLMFSSMEIVLKTVTGLYNPIQLNLIRFLIGGLVLLPLARHDLKVNGQKLSLFDYSMFALTGFLCVVVSMTLYQLAIIYDSPATVAVLFSCNPVFALMFAFLLLHERLDRAEVLSLLITIVGLVVIVNPANLTNPIGTSLGILSALTFGFYSIISRWAALKDDLGGIPMTAYTFIAGAIELFILVSISHIHGVSAWLNQSSWLKSFSNIPVLTNVTPNHFLVLFFISVCVTGGGFAFYFLAMQRGGVAMASLVFFIKPALAPILAMILIHERLTTNMVIGIIVIILGSVISFIDNQRQQVVS